MPWLPLYATEEDLQNVFSWLSGEEELAFLLNDGPRSWRAHSRCRYTGDARYCLWHVAGGPLPLLGQRGSAPRIVGDPWNGWTEIRTGADPTTPYFGPGHPGIIWLNARARSKRKPNGVGLSSFEWIGNRYRTIGSAATPQTERLWKRLGRSIKKGARQIPREGPCDGPHPEIWALPGALAAIISGIQRDENPSR